MPINIFGSGSGGGASTNQLQVIYVGKAGNDTNSGLNSDKAKLTIGAAITAVGTPTSILPYAIQVLDGAVYTDSFTVPVYTILDAENAELTGTVSLTDATSYARYKVNGIRQTKNLGLKIDTLDVPKQLITNSSTGLFDGGVISINTDTTKFDVSSGSGIIVDSYTNPSNPTHTPISWGAFTAVVPTFLATAGTTFLSIDIAGALVQSITSPNGANLRDKIQIGSIIHPNNTTITNTSDLTQAPIQNLSQTIADMNIAIGVINEAGNVYSGTVGATTIEKTAGISFYAGLNYKANKKNPNKITTPVKLAATKFVYTWRDGAGGFNTSLSSTISVGLFDDGTGGALSPQGIVNNNNWSIDRISYSPDANTTIVQFGQTEYNTLNQALDALARGTDTFIADPEFQDVPLRSFLIRKGNATDLSNTTQARFLDTGKFGTSSSTSSSNVGVVTLQSAYDNSGDPELVTDTSKNAVSFRRGTLADTDDVFTVQNGIGTDTFKVTGNGDITANTVNGLTVQKGIGNTSIVLGFGAIDASVISAIAIGNITNADGDQGIAIGELASLGVGGDKGIAIGSFALVNSLEGIAIGKSTTGGAKSVAIGSGTTTSSNSVAIGVSASATGNPSLALGFNTSATSGGSLAIGWSALASGLNSISIGKNSDASQSSSIAIGFGSQALHANSSAIGYTASTTSINQVMLGTGADTVVCPNNLEVNGTTTYSGATSGTTSISAVAVAGTTALTLPSATDTLVGKATTDTLTNKTFDANGTGNSISNVDLTSDIIGVLPITNGGTGSGVASTALSNLGGVGSATTDTLTNKTFDANGIGNSISNIDVVDLSNGTDGELITWSATGAPTTVAVGTAAQVLTSNGVGAAPTFQALSAGGLSTFTSTEQTLTTAGLLTIAHGLGVEPLGIEVLLVCKVANSGYSIGDKVAVAKNNINGGAMRAASVSINATNVVVRFSNAVPLWQITNKATGSFVDLTSSYWRLIIKAWG